jgi:hypothetical protein
MDSDATCGTLAKKAASCRRAARHYAANREAVLASANARHARAREQGQRVLDHCVATGLSVPDASTALGAPLTSSAHRWASARLASHQKRVAKKEAKAALLAEERQQAKERQQAAARERAAAKAKEREEALAARKNLSQERAARRLISQRAICRAIHRRNAEATRDIRAQAAAERKEARRLEALKRQEARSQAAREALAAERAAKGYRVLYIKRRKPLVGGTYA